MSHSPWQSVAERLRRRTASDGGRDLLVSPADAENQVSLETMPPASEAVHLQQMLDLMLRIDAFKDVPRSELPILALAFTTRVFSSGEVIVRQGDPGTELFFIQDGSVVVKTRTSAEAEEIEIAALHYGQYFGEAALLTDAPRNASVYASGREVTLSILTREQFQAYGLQSKMRLQIKDAELRNGLGILAMSCVSCKNLAKLFLALGIYLGSSIFIYQHFEGWSATDCLYFAVSTLLSVGYGDVRPSHAASRLYVVIFVALALIWVTVFIGDFLESLVTAEIRNEKARKALHIQQPQAIGIFDEDSQKRHRRWKLCKCVLAIVLLIGANMIIAKFLLDDAQTFIDALYFAIITLTTIGYGDIVPKRPEAKWAVMVVCLFGVPLFGFMLAQIVDIVYGKARDDQIHTVVGGLTTEKFDQLIEFCDGMAIAGAYNSKPQDSRRDQITPFEFLSFVMVKNDTMDIEDIRAIMANFSDLDTGTSGMLDVADLEEWQRRGAVNPACITRQSSNLGTEHGRSVSSEISLLSGSFSG